MIPLAYILKILISLELMVTVMPVKGSYPMTTRMKERIPSRGCTASFVRNNTLYSYGGESKSLYESTDFTAISFDEVDGSLIYNPVPQANSGPRVSCSTAILLPDGNTVLLIGGSSFDIFQNENETNILLLYQYTFDSQTWVPLPVNVDPQASTNASLLPRNRYGHTSTLASNGLIYILGGANMDCTGSFVPDAWIYNYTASLFTPFQTFNNTCFCGHAGVSLPNGIIWYGFGLSGLGGTYVNSSTTYPTGANISFLFNTSDGTWSLQTNDQMFVDSGKVFSSVVLGPDKRHIYSFGGSNFDYPTRRLYRSSIDVLDTDTWRYVVEDVTPIDGVCPSRREMAISGIIRDNYLVVGLGVSRTQYYNDISVMQLPHPEPNGTINVSDLRWISSIVTNDTDDKTAFSTEARSSNFTVPLLVLILIVTFIAVVLLSWKLRHQASSLSTYLIQFIWKPRVGEPKWTEAISLVFRATLVGAFLAILVVLLKQVLHSPFGTVSTVKAVEYVNIPDIRFCFSGFSNTIDIFEMSCITDGSMDCNQYLRPLNTEQHIPYYLSSDGHSRCYLFTTTLNGDDFKLASINEPEVNNGTKVHFTVFSTVTNTINDTISDSRASVIRVSVYPPGRNPNLQFVDGASRPKTMSDKDFENWLFDDTRGLIADNVFYIYDDEEALVQYEIEKHEHLSSASKIWNYVGIAPVYDELSKVTISSRVENNFREDRPEAPGKRSTISEVTFMPKQYVFINVREQQIYTLVNSLGFAGGILGLFTAIHVLLFGNRPGSPWGLVQRWSVGRTKQSLHYALRSSYKDIATSIPFPSYHSTS
ncbi:hypothetical protein BJV82DRAFT_618791 [Fennellomyces sp. T-0311]|nr:hypothetical protein BJV82DRAFT_618791 [Fennellomyces sp. T-0311]